MSRSALVLLSAVVLLPAAMIPVPNAPNEEAYAGTFSIVAYDPATKEYGIAVASKYLGVGGVVPHARAGAGAVATQALVNITLGEKGVELLARGKSAKETLDELKKGDPRIGFRQLGLIDGKGEAITYTGPGCLRWAGGKTGKHHTVQGNILKGEGVIDAMSKAYEANPKVHLAWRLFAALEAGDQAGGDTRGKQSAGILVVRPGGGPNGFGDRLVDLRVDDHATPVEELARILAKRVPRPKVK
jgi:uncharacterized Ntn-hydrolase superfamily protein